MSAGGEQGSNPYTALRGQMSVGGGQGSDPYTGPLYWDSFGVTVLLNLPSNLFLFSHATALGKKYSERKKAAAEAAALMSSEYTAPDYFR